MTLPPRNGTVLLRRLGEHRRVVLIVASSLLILCVGSTTALVVSLLSRKTWRDLENPANQIPRGQRVDIVAQGGGEGPGFLSLGPGFNQALTVRFTCNGPGSMRLAAPGLSTGLGCDQGEIQASYQWAATTVARSQIVVTAEQSTRWRVEVEVAGG
jgi:hypothetical protein